MLFELVPFEVIVFVARFVLAAERAILRRDLRCGGGSRRRRNSADAHQQSDCRASEEGELRAVFHRFDSRSWLIDEQEAKDVLV